MKIEAGKYYKLRNGLKAEVLKVYDWKTDYPFIGVIFNGELFSVETWTIDGFQLSSHSDGPFDIVSEWVDPVVPVEFWGNVYRLPDGFLHVRQHLSKESAFENAAEDCIRTAKFREVIK